MAQHRFPIFFSASSTSGLINDVAIIGFHDNWLYSSSCDKTWNKYIAINETTRPDDTRPRPQCLEAKAIAIEAKAEASFFGLEAGPRTYIPDNYMAWILICKFGGKICYNNRDKEFFLGDYFLLAHLFMYRN